MGPVRVNNKSPVSVTHGAQNTSGQGDASSQVPTVERGGSAIAADGWYPGESATTTVQ